MDQTFPYHACWAAVREDAKDTSEIEERGKDSSNEMGNDLEVKLEEVFQDLKSKLKENDPQINTGVQKFIDRFNTMKSNALLASALHQFGSMYAGVATSRQGGRLRRGPRIPIQATAAGRSMDPEESLQHQKDVLPCTAPQNPTQVLLIGT